MTLEEQERRAYADGDVERAALLARVIEAEDQVARYKWVDGESDA